MNLHIEFIRPLSGERLSMPSVTWRGPHPVYLAPWQYSYLRTPRESSPPPEDKMTTRLPHWDSSRLSNVLQQEFKAYLNTTAHITIWRHAAIAISRKHLGGAKFKRDYGSEPAPTWVAEQTGHTAYVAGNVYARGIEEAPGHVASARAEYRALSRSWHSFLGFGVYLGILPPNSLKRPREDSREGLKEHDQAGHLREAVNIEAEVQRRAKLELLKTKSSIQLAKRHKTKQVERVVGEEVD